MLILIAAGIVVIILPDNGERLFYLSRDHGPSLEDAIGLLLVFIGYGWFLKQTWKRREKILQYKNRFSFKLIPPLIVIGIALIIVSVINDYGYWWLCGAIILIILQSIVFYFAEGTTAVEVSDTTGDESSTMVGNKILISKTCTYILLKKYFLLPRRKHCQINFQ